jgi:hypothetical protein
MKVWVYIDNSREVRDVDHLKVLRTRMPQRNGSRKNDPEGRGVYV